VSSDKPRPLAGVSVLDLARFIAGPLCAQVLGDLGADVIKVERPSGEDSREALPLIKGESLYTLAFNRNKRGVTLNLRKPEAKPILARLIEWADIVVENFRPGVMDAMGCGYETLRQSKPAIIMASVSGFGQDGPLAQRALFDPIAQGLSGLMYMTGHEGDPPLMAGSFIADYSAALYAVIGTLSALRLRDATGQGQHIDVALVDSAFSLLISNVPLYDLLGQTLPRSGNRDRFGAPANSFRCRDGYVYLDGSSDSLFPRLAEAIGKPELATDPRYAKNEARSERVEELERYILEWLGNMTREQCVAALDRAGVPCGPILTVGEAMESEQLRYRNQICEVDHPVLGRVRISGVPVTGSGMTCEVRLPAPTIGQHNEEVYAQLCGLTRTEIASLREKGVL